MPSLVRKSNLVFLLALVFLLLAAGVPAPGLAAPPGLPQDASRGGQTPPGATGTPGYNDYARFIAGLSNPQGTLAASKHTPAWTGYASFISRSWERFKQQHLEPMRQWAAHELASANTAAVFYPFSGPDFVNMYTLFPHAKTYLMIALEPVGEIPDFAALDASQFFAQLERSLNDLLQLNFFITTKLDNSLEKPGLRGILPVLLFFLAREPARVIDVRYWLLKPDGTIEETPAKSPMESGPGDVTGVRLDFVRSGSQEKQTLYYFRFNLRNNFFQRYEKFIAFLKGFGPLTTFAKAASYLMHKPNYSGLRQFILDQSQYVLQSDSAIPVKYFDRNVWNLRFFGTYTTPIDYFKNYEQKDLAEIYQQAADVYPLPFGIGYRHRVHTSNLMFAWKKAAAVAGGLK
jgi:hypothetical protein